MIRDEGLAGLQLDAVTMVSQRASGVADLQRGEARVRTAFSSMNWSSEMLLRSPCPTFAPVSQMLWPK
jgi:hypothetical protein